MSAREGWKSVKLLNGRQGCECQCHWDLSWLRFGDSRIGFGDVDGLFVVERNGYFLYLETKTDEEAIPLGQEILLNQLSRVEKFTVLVVRGPKGDPAIIQRIDPGVWGPEQSTTREDFQRRVDSWFEIANGRDPW